MSRRGRLLSLAMAGAALAAPGARAFVIIDTAGPRELIAPSTAGKPAAASVKLSTKDKSLTGFYFWHRGGSHHPENAAEIPAHTAHTWGASLKFKASKGVEEFLNLSDTPATEAGLLWNATWFGAGRPAATPDAAPSIPAIHSLTIQPGYSYEAVSHVPLTGNPLQETRTAKHRATYVNASYGVYWRGLRGPVNQLALVVSGEVRRQSNAADLPTVTVGKLTSLPATPDGDATRVALAGSKAVRWGDLDFATAYPLTAALVLQHGADALGDVFSAADGATLRLFWAPYYRYTASSELGDARAAGLSLTVRIKTAAKDGKPGKLEYPLSVFYEWATKPGKDEWKGKAGAGVTFSWGP